jgi:hypothetical protein
MNNPQPWWLTWPVAEVAAVILPLFARQVPATHPKFHQNLDDVMESIVNWFRTGDFSPRRPRAFARWPAGRTFQDPDFGAVAEAMQVLEHAGLLMRALEVQDYSYFQVGLTRLGWNALQTNTVRQHLGLSDTPPTT